MKIAFIIFLSLMTLFGTSGLVFTENTEYFSAHATTHEEIDNEGKIVNSISRSTDMTIKIKQGSELGFALVEAELIADNGKEVYFSADIFVDGEFKKTIGTGNKVTEVEVGNGEYIQADFRGFDNNGIVYLPSVDAIKIPSYVKSPQTMEENIQDFSDRFLNFSSFVSLLFGFFVSIMVGFIFERLHETQRFKEKRKICLVFEGIRRFKRVLFVFAATLLLTLFVISDDNEISDSIGILEPLSFFNMSDTNFAIFGLILGYMVIWIYEILHIKNNPNELSTR